MMKKCPFCNHTIEDGADICPSCNNSLIITCPYCKQEIKAYDTVCPYCTTSLVKKDGYLFLIALILFIVWALANTAGLFLIKLYPQILTLKDKDGDLLLPFAEYINLCLKPIILIIVPYIIAIVRRTRVKFAICGIIINLIFAIIFISCFIKLQQQVM